MNATIAYFQAFTDGKLDSFATHAALVGAIAIAEISLGIGIWLESPKDKKLREWLGVLLVLGGCVFSVIATVALLIFDEGISRAQQSKIIELETRLADRTLSDEAIARIGASAAKFPGQHFMLHSYWQDPEPTAFAIRLGQAALVRIAHWQPIAENSHLVGRVTGIVIDVADGADDRFHKAAAALAGALKAEYPDVRLGNDQADATMISIIVGQKR